MVAKTFVPSAIATMLFLGLILSGCLSLSVDKNGIKADLTVRQEGAKQDTNARPCTISCDLRIIDASDGSVVACATGEAGTDRLADLGKALARKLREGTLIKGESVAVVSLRNRGETPHGKAVAEEIADKVAGALVETGWFDVKERIDLRGILTEKDLDTAGMVKNPDVRRRLAGVKYIVIGGVTVTEAAAK